MSHLTTALRAVTAAALMGGFACLGTGTASADPTDTLAGSLSKGYTTSNCTSETPPNGASAFLQCGQNSDPKGPIFAEYFLFNNNTDMASSFASSIGADTLTKCGDTTSPTTWRLGTSTDSAGQVACGTHEGSAEVIWTTDAKNVLSLIRGSNGDTATLYQWWRTNG